MGSVEPESDALIQNHYMVSDQGLHCLPGIKQFLDTSASSIMDVQILGITKTCLCYVDPLKPHFYIVKVGFTGVYIIFLTSAQNIDCGHSLEPPQWGSSNKYPQSMFLSRNKKNIRIFT